MPGPEPLPLPRVWHLPASRGTPFKTVALPPKRHPHIPHIAPRESRRRPAWTPPTGPPSGPRPFTRRAPPHNTPTARHRSRERRGNCHRRKPAIWRISRTVEEKRPNHVSVNLWPPSPGTGPSDSTTVVVCCYRIRSLKHGRCGGVGISTPGLFRHCDSKNGCQGEGKGAQTGNTRFIAPANDGHESR